MLIWIHDRIYLLFQIFFYSPYRNWRSQYKHSNIKISVIKYDKNMTNIWKKIHIVVV